MHSLKYKMSAPQELNGEGIGDAHFKKCIKKTTFSVPTSKSKWF